MSSFITKTKVASATVPNASAGKINEFVDTDGLTKSKNESGTLEIYSGTAAVAAHVALPDPHPQYLTPTEANALYDAIGAAATVQSNLTNHLVDAGNPHPQYIQESDNLFINPQVVKVKISDAGFGEFTDLADAVASITDSDPETKPYIIELGAGVFTVNNPIVLPDGVSLKGQGINATTVSPQNPAQHLIVYGLLSEVSFLNLKGVAGSIGSGKAALYSEDVGEFAQAHKVSIYDFDIAIDNYANAADSIIYVEYVDVNGNYIYGARNRSNAGNLASMQLENFYSYASAGANPVHIYSSGATSELALNSNGLTGGADNIGIQVVDGAKISASDTFVKNFSGTNGLGFSNPNIGAGCFLEINALSFLDNTDDISILNLATDGTINGSADKLKTTVIAASPLAIFLTDTEVGGITFTGEINYAANDLSKITDIAPLLGTSSTMGVFLGGALTDGGGLTINIAQLFGYLSTGLPPAGYTKYIKLNASTLVLPASSSVFVYVNTSGVIVSNASAPNTEQNILLGRAITGASTILFIESTPLNSYRYSNKIDKVFREALGSIFSTGSLVSESGTRNLDVTAGKYFYSETEFNLVGGAAITYSSFYESAVSGVYTQVTGVTTVDKDFYDDGTGTLASIPSGKFAKHLLLVIGGAVEKYSMVYATAFYNTQAEAVAAELPVAPSFMSGAFARIAGLIISPSTSTILEFTDERPRIGFASSSSAGGITDHGALSGLGDNDHNQYLLRDGSNAMTNNLDLGGNSITNVNLVDGIDVTTHASRHIPSGADPLPTGVPSDIGSANAAGILNAFARQDHIHQLPNVGTASTYGSASQVPVITTDAKGRITTAVNTAISIVAAAVGDFAAAVRSTLLTGIDTTTTEIEVTAADTVLQGIGKLQGQVNLWTELITTADLTTNSNTTFTSVTELGKDVVAGKSYYYEYTILFQSTNTGTGVALSLNGSGLGGQVAGVVNIPISAVDGTAALFTGNITSFGDVVTGSGAQATNTTYIANIKGVFQSTATGTFYPVFRSETAFTTVRVMTGSVALLREF